MQQFHPTHATPLPARTPLSIPQAPNAVPPAYTARTLPHKQPEANAPRAAPSHPGTTPAPPSPPIPCRSTRSTPNPPPIRPGSCTTDAAHTSRSRGSPASPPLSGPDTPSAPSPGEPRQPHRPAPQTRANPSPYKRTSDCANPHQPVPRPEPPQPSAHFAPEPTTPLDRNIPRSQTPPQSHHYPLSHHAVCSHGERA
jgi:hypothetical protein